MLALLNKRDKFEW